MLSRSQILVGALAAVCSSALVAQAQPSAQQSAPQVQPQSPAKTQTTTTQSTTSTTAVPDQSGNPVAVQKRTDTNQTTTTQPANAAPQSSTSHTTSTTTVAPDATGAPAATTTTTTTQQATDQTGATLTPATAADVKKGVPVFDAKGGVVGKVESVSAKGAVVSTGTARATIPVASFGKNDKGLVVSMTKAEIEAAANPSKATKTTKPGAKPK